MELSSVRVSVGVDHLSFSVNEVIFKLSLINLLVRQNHLSKAVEQACSELSFVNSSFHQNKPSEEVISVILPRPQIDDLLYLPVQNESRNLEIIHVLSLENELVLKEGVGKALSHVVSNLSNVAVLFPEEQTQASQRASSELPNHSAVVELAHSEVFETEMGEEDEDWAKLLLEK